MKRNVVNVFGNNAVITPGNTALSPKLKWVLAIGVSTCILVVTSYFIYINVAASNNHLFAHYYQPPRHIDKMLAHADSQHEAVGLFMQAEKAIATQDYHRAIELYDAILKEPDSDMLAEEASWYKALCLMKVNARPDIIYYQFIDVLKYNGRYRAEALKILSLKFSDDPSVGK